MAGDSITLVPDRRYVSFRFSYPNLIHMSGDTVRDSVAAVEPRKQRSSAQRTAASDSSTAKVVERQPAGRARRIVLRRWSAEQQQLLFVGGEQQRVICGHDAL